MWLMRSCKLSAGAIATASVTVVCPRASACIAVRVVSASSACVGNTPFEAGGCALANDIAAPSNQIGMVSVSGAVIGRQWWLEAQGRGHDRSACRHFAGDIRQKVSSDTSACAARSQRAPPQPPSSSILRMAVARYRKRFGRPCGGLAIQVMSGPSPDETAEAMS